MNPWVVVITSLIGGGGVAGLLVYFIAPATDRLALRRRDKDDLLVRLERTEKDVYVLRSDVERLMLENANLKTVLAVILQHDETLRDRIIKLDPSAEVPTTAEVLRRVGMSVNIILGVAADAGEGEKT